MGTRKAVACLAFKAGGQHGRLETEKRSRNSAVFFEKWKGIQIAVDIVGISEMQKCELKYDM